jgi:hypothetical protein
MEVQKVGLRPKQQVFTDLVLKVRDYGFNLAVSLDAELVPDLLFFRFE